MKQEPEGMSLRESSDFSSGDNVKARAYTFGDNIHTDQIYPGRYLELTEPAQIAGHLMEGADPSFVSRFGPGGIIVGGRNFGCGSSREHAAIALSAAEVRAVIAESFARIFFRNCINPGSSLDDLPRDQRGCRGRGQTFPRGWSAT